MSTFRLEIVTPEHVVFSDDVESVSLPTTEGEITVLPNHMPLVTVLQAGEMVIRKGGQATPYAISSGFIHVEPKKLVILADTAERVEEIDEARAEEARRRAETLQQKKEAIDDVEFARMAAKLERDLNRLRIVRKYRHRGHIGITQEGVRHEDIENEESKRG